MNRHGRNTILLLIALGFGFWLIRAVLIQPEFEAPENQTRKIVGMLSPEKQLELWKNEQLAHELEQKFCHDFLIQWSQRKAAVIETMLTGEFTATVPAVPWKERTIDSIVERNRSFPGEEDVRRCSNAEFVSYLLEPPAQLDPISLDASLASFYQSEKGFLIGKILLGMTGMDNNGHLNEFSSVQEVGLKRSERPGEEDQYEIAQWVILEETWKVSPQKFFTEITETSGLDSIKINDHWTLEIANRKTARLTYQVQMAVEDFDNDLDPDVLVCTADGNYFLFENQNGRYRDVSKKIQIEPDSAKDFQISWSDVNGDYFPDLILGTQLLISQAGQSFVVTSTQIPPGQVQPVDVNCDGQLDLHITRCNCWPYQFNASKQATDEHTFLINCGNGQFQTYQIPSRSNLNVASVTAAKWFYFDDDLKPDLLVTRFGQSNEVWINHSDGQNIDFQLVNKLQAEFSANALTTGAAIADFDNNEKLDFIVTQPYSTIAQRILGEIRLDDYPVPPPPESRLGNLGVQFFRGRNPKDIRRDWILEPQSQPRQSCWSWNPNAADFNNDGWTDLYLPAGMNSADSQACDGESCFWMGYALMPNDRFRPMRQLGPFSMIPGQVWYPDSKFILENDENLAAFQRNQLFLNQSGKSYQDISFSSGADIKSDSRSAIALDFNQDGRLDLLVSSAGKEAVRMFRNESQSGNSLFVRLKGKSSNSRGIGARLRLETGKKVLTREVFVGSGVSAQTSPCVHFGLGNQKSVGSLQIQWPDGLEQNFENLSANQIILIEQGKPEIANAKVLNLAK